jgi:hypothetical protein
MEIHLCLETAGIRPAYFYQDDEVVVVASERPVIKLFLMSL